MGPRTFAGLSGKFLLPGLTSALPSVSGTPVPVELVVAELRSIEAGLLGFASSSGAADVPSDDACCGTTGSPTRAWPSKGAEALL